MYYKNVVGHACHLAITSEEKSTEQSVLIRNAVLCTYMCKPECYTQKNLLIIINFCLTKMLVKYAINMQ